MDHLTTESAQFWREKSARIFDSSSRLQALLQRLHEGRRVGVLEYLQVEDTQTCRSLSSANCLPPRDNASPMSERWKSLNASIIACERCPRLGQHCEEVAHVKRKAFASETYWGKPVPNFGVAPASLLIVGLAPAAHGGNRTGRVFTGDRSGDWLFRALHKAGFANQPQATHRGDGLRLIDCAITAACHCAPPGNKPTLAELSNCRSFLETTFELVQPRVVLALGQIGWRAMLKYYREHALLVHSPRFGHGAQHRLPNGVVLLASFHPSQQNTFTGKLTESMFDDIFSTAKNLLKDARR